jgi:hypothetical protein
LTSGGISSVKTAAAWGRMDPATVAASRDDREVEQMASMRRKSKGGREEEAEDARGRTKGADDVGQHWAEGRKVPFL